MPASGSRTPNGAVLAAATNNRVSCISLIATRLMLRHACASRVSVDKRRCSPDPLGSPVAAEASVMVANCEPDMPDSRILAPVRARMRPIVITVTLLWFTFLLPFVPQDS